MTVEELESDWRARWHRALDRFMPFAWIYEGSRFGGSDVIVKSYLSIPDNLPLPVTFQHGVPTGTSDPAFDVNKPEPLFLALTEESAQVAQRTKPVLRFPHPWLLLPKLAQKAIEPHGTLFVGMPSGPGNNERLARAVEKSGLPRPWTILLKWRGLDDADVQWWSSREFNVESSGPPVSQSFYLNQRAIIARHEAIAIPYMSSIAVFAAVMRKPVHMLPRVEMQYVAEPDLKLPKGPTALAIWRNLLSNDCGVAEAEALRLLGAAYLAEKDTLRKRLFEAVTALQDPIHIGGVSNPAVLRLLTLLWSRRFPVQKLLPTPMHSVARKLKYLAGLNRLKLVSGNEFEHFGLAEGPGLRVIERRAYQVGRKIGLGEAPRKKDRTN